MPILRAAFAAATRAGLYLRARPDAARPARSHPTGAEMDQNYSTQFPSVRDDVSASEWETRVNLAACYRLVDKFGMSDLIYNHITARIPGSDEHLLINL